MPKLLFALQSCNSYWCSCIYLVVSYVECYLSALFCICSEALLCTSDMKVWCMCYTTNSPWLICANNNCFQNLKTTVPCQVIQSIRGWLRTHNPNQHKMSIWNRTKDLIELKFSPNVPVLDKMVMSVCCCGTEFLCFLWAVLTLSPQHRCAEKHLLWCWDIYRFFYFQVCV